MGRRRPKRQETWAKGPVEQEWTDTLVEFLVNKPGIRDSKFFLAVLGAVFNARQLHRTNSFVVKASYFDSRDCQSSRRDNRRRIEANLNLMAKKGLLKYQRHPDGYLIELLGGFRVIPGIDRCDNNDGVLPISAEDIAKTVKFLKPSYGDEEIVGDDIDTDIE